MIHERFLALPQEKQRKLINAGYQVFGLNEYKKASTEEIAREAGISKGYLFYYFRNKKDLYLYLYERAVELSRRQVLDEGFAGITDFFDMMAYAARRKLEMVAESPYLLPFIVRAFYSQREEPSEDLGRRMAAVMKQSYQDAFRHLDLTPFKPGIDPLYVMRMLQWMGDGWLHERQMQGGELSLQEMTDAMDRMMRTMRTLCYKEDHL